MSEVKIIVSGDADLEIAVSAFKAMWANGAMRVSFERMAPVVTKMTIKFDVQPSKTDP